MYFSFCFVMQIWQPRLNPFFLPPSSQLGCEVTDAQTFMQSFIFSFGWYDLHCLGCNHQLRSQSCVYLHNIQYVCHSEPFIVFREGARCVSFCHLFKQQPKNLFRAGTTRARCKSKSLFVSLSDDAFLYRFFLKPGPRGGA